MERWVVTNKTIGMGFKSEITEEPGICPVFQFAKGDLDSEVLWWIMNVINLRLLYLIWLC